MAAFVYGNLASNYAKGRFEAEAAEHGFEPGVWPEQVQTNLGDCSPLFLQRQNEVGAVYQQKFTHVIVKVWND